MTAFIPFKLTRCRGAPLLADPLVILPVLRSLEPIPLGRSGRESSPQRNDQNEHRG
jgi:hypothetical protein